MPDEGTVEVLGCRPGDRGRELRARLGAVLDQAALYTRLSVESNLRFYGALYPGLTGRLEDRINEVLQLVELTDRRRQAAGELSLGLRKRLALARALLPEPELLLLDEPTSGLDPGAAKKFRHLIHDFRERGGTVFLTTHLMSEAEHLCQRVAIIEAGKLLCQGEPQALMDQHLEPDSERSLEHLFYAVTEKQDSPS